MDSGLVCNDWNHGLYCTLITHPLGLDLFSGSSINPRITLLWRSFVIVGFSVVFFTHVEQFLCMRDLVGQTPLHAGAGDKIIIWESEQTYRDPGAAQLESRTRCYRVFMCVPLYVAHCIICYCWGSRVLSSPDWILIQGRQRPSDTVTELNYWGCSVTGSVVACYEYSAAGQISSHSVLAVIGGSDEDMSRCRRLGRIQGIKLNWM